MLNINAELQVSYAHIYKRVGKIFYILMGYFSYHMPPEGISSISNKIINEIRHTDIQSTHNSCVSYLIN